MDGTTAWLCTLHGQQAPRVVTAAHGAAHPHGRRRLVMHRAWTASPKAYPWRTWCCTKAITAVHGAALPPAGCLAYFPSTLAAWPLPVLEAAPQTDQAAQVLVPLCPAVSIPAALLQRCTGS